MKNGVIWCTIDDEQDGAPDSMATPAERSTLALGPQTIWQRPRGNRPNRPSRVIRNKEVDVRAADRVTLHGQLAIPAGRLDLSAGNSRAQLRICLAVKRRLEDAAAIAVPFAHGGVAILAIGPGHAAAVEIQDGMRVHTTELNICA